MATLKELYSTLKSLREMDLPISEDLKEEANKLEERIIKEQILPLIRKNVEPHLMEIERELMLLIEYNPSQPLRVAISRHSKMHEIEDAVHITPTEEPMPLFGESDEENTSRKPRKTRVVENKTKGLKITFEDGTVVWEKNCIESFLEALRKIGLAKVNAVGIMWANGEYNLVDKKERKKDNYKWQKRCDGWYIYSNTNTIMKVDYLTRISDYYGLNLLIEVERLSNKS